MAIVDDDMREVSIYSLLPDSPNDSPSAVALLPADLAWADSCLNKDMDGISMDWTSMKDVLMEIVSSQTGSLNCSSTESGRQSTYCEFLLSGENVTNPFDIRSEKDGNLIVDDIGDAEYIEVSEDDEEGLVLGTQKGTVRGRSRLGSVFQPNCTEDIGKMEHLGSGLDLSLTTYEVEHSSEEIFGVWDLGISDECHTSVSFSVRASSSYADETAGLVPLPGSNNESWCQGLDGLASRSAAYYQQGARFAKWRTVVSIPNGPSALAVKEAAWGLARYAATCQDNGLVPIVEPEILLDGDHGIERTFEVAQKVWAEVFFYLAENNVLFAGILLKPSMVTPGAECNYKASPQQVADYTLKLLYSRIPPAFLSGGQSEVEATENLNAMNQKPHPWHVSFSYARALQNTCLKTWGGRPENVQADQEALLVRAKANSLAQLGKYTGEGESHEAKKGMFVKGYTY
ncbi:hypothetical protein Cgig2_032559 [Carnegiea gigantea]|uniref:fructose-bisphosphate aldolase n=1 Tax=Carnegiea gigantea TaxID=171969 RepID=A0A9Q1KWF3_9CARY|nr:hypothetical protein Cgig2_032559 [Carnegiea gigantea]